MGEGVVGEVDIDGVWEVECGVVKERVGGGFVDDERVVDEVGGYGGEVVGVGMVWVGGCWEVVCEYGVGGGLVYDWEG